MKILPILVLVFFSVAVVNAQSPNDPGALPSPSIPAGPQPTATVSQVTASPQPTAAVTPLPSASPAGTQPQTTNTATPSP